MVRLETYGHVPRATGLIRVFVFIRLYEFPRPRVAISRLSRSYLGKNSPPQLANFRGERAICRWGSEKRSDTYALPPSTNSFLPLNVTATVFTHFCSPFPLRFHSLRCALIASPRIRIFRKPNRGLRIISLRFDRLLLVRVERTSNTTRKSFLPKFARGTGHSRADSCFSLLFSDSNSSLENWYIDEECRVAGGRFPWGPSKVIREREDGREEKRERERVTRNKKTSISRHSRVSAVVTERQRSLGVEPSVNSNLSRASTFAFANRAQDPLPTSTSQRISRSRISANKLPPPPS